MCARVTKGNKISKLVWKSKTLDNKSIFQSTVWVFCRARADFNAAVQEDDGQPDLFERKTCNLIIDTVQVTIRGHNQMAKHFK